MLMTSFSELTLTDETAVGCCVGLVGETGGESFPPQLHNGAESTKATTQAIAVRQGMQADHRPILPARPGVAFGVSSIGRGQPSPGSVAYRKRARVADDANAWDVAS